MTRPKRVEGLSLYSVGDGDLCQVVVSFVGTPLVLLVDIPSAHAYSVQAVACEVCCAVESKVGPCSATYIERLVKRCLQDL